MTSLEAFAGKVMDWMWLGIVALCGVVYQRQNGRIDEIRKDVDNMEGRISSRFDRFEDKLDAHCERIYDKLDGKVDK